MKKISINKPNICLLLSMCLFFIYFLKEEFYKHSDKKAYTCNIYNDQVFVARVASPIHIDQRSHIYNAGFFQER